MPPQRPTRLRWPPRGAPPQSGGRPTGLPFSLEAPQGCPRAARRGSRRIVAKRERRPQRSWKALQDQGTASEPRSKAGIPSSLNQSRPGAPPSSGKGSTPGGYRTGFGPFHLRYRHPHLHAVFGQSAADDFRSADGDTVPPMSAYLTASLRTVANWYPQRRAVQPPCPCPTQAGLAVWRLANGVRQTSSIRAQTESVHWKPVRNHLRNTRSPVIVHWLSAVEAPSTAKPISAL